MADDSLSKWLGSIARHAATRPVSTVAHQKQSAVPTVRSGRRIIHLIDALERRQLLSTAPAVFLPAASFDTKLGALAVVAADVSGDSKPDLIVATGGNRVGVLLGNGDGTFKLPLLLPAGAGTSAVAVANVNNDGFADLIVTNGDDNTVSVFLGKGGGTFQPQVFFNTGENPVSVAVQDVSKDGNPDLIVANSNSDTVSVLLGNGNGTFKPQTTLAVGSAPASVAVADVNGDGRLDLVVANFLGNVSVLPGNGNGTFKSQSTFAAGSGAQAVALADVTRDGKLDIIVANAFDQTVGVLAGDGHGSFGAQRTFATGIFPKSIAVGDINGDGALDLIVANPSSNNVSILRGEGKGEFLDQVTFATGGNPTSVALLDVNGDGTPDVITADNSDNTASVLLNNPRPVVSSINRAIPAGTTDSTPTATFAVTFNKPVTGVDQTDFALALSGVSANSTLAVSGGGAVYTVTVGGITGAGTLGLNLANNGSIHDSLGSQLSEGNFTGQVYRVIPTPTVAVTSGNRVYSGKPYNPTTTVKGISGTDGTSAITYTYYAGSTATGTPLSGAPITVGTYSVVAHFAGDSTYAAADSAPLVFQITRKTLTATIVALSKSYDGTAEATVTYSLAGIVGQDIVTADGVAVFSDAKVGTGKTVKATGLTLSGADAGNYSVNASATTTANILQLPLTLSFNGSGEIPVASFSWKEQANVFPGTPSVPTSVSSPSLSDMTVNLAPGAAAEPQLMVNLASRTKFSQVVLRVRDLYSHLQYLTYTLGGVYISSYETASLGNVPSDSLALHFETIRESYAPIGSDGTLGTPVVTSYDSLKRTSTGVGAILPPKVPSPWIGVSFGNAKEIEVGSFSWDAGITVSPGSPSVPTKVSNPAPSDLTLNLQPGTAEPQFMVDLATGQNFTQVVLHVRNKAGQEYLTYMLSGVYLSGFTTSSSGNFPSDSLTLHFDKVEQSYRPSVGNVLGPMAIASYDNIHKAVSSPATTIEGPGSSDFRPLAVSFDGRAEISVKSFSWGEDATVIAGKGPIATKVSSVSLADVTLTLDAETAEPYIFGNLSAGTQFHSIVLHVRDSLRHLEYLIYTFSDAYLSHYSTSVSSDSHGNILRSDSLVLHFDKIQESYAPILGNGTLGAPVVTSYDTLKKATTGRAAIAARAASTPPAGLSFNGGNEIAVDSFNWGEGVTVIPGSTSGPTKISDLSFSDLTLNLSAGSAEPQLLANLAAGTKISQVVLHVRNGIKKEYLTYTLSGVFLSSYTTGSESPVLVPSGTLALHFDKIQESYAAIRPDGTLGTPVVSSYDNIKQAVTGLGTIAGPSADPVVPMGVSFDGGNELAAQSYNWGADVDVTPGSGAVPTTVGERSLSDLSLHLTPGSTEPRILVNLATGTRFSQVVLHLRDSSKREYVTYTLSNVYLSAYNTVADSGTAPTAELTLHFDKIQESYSPTVEGGLGKPVVTSYDSITGNRTGVGAIVGPKGAGITEKGVTFNGGDELSIGSYRWSEGVSITPGTASIPTSVSKPSLSDITLDLAPGAAEAQLLVNLAAGTSFTQVVLRVRDAAGLVYLTYTLTGVYLSHYSTHSAGASPSDSVTLHFDKIQESYTPIINNVLGTPVVTSYDTLTNSSNGKGSVHA